MPDTLNGAPFTVIVEIVKFAVPAFDKVTVEFVLLPTMALPTPNAKGLTTSCGWGVAVLAETLISVSVAAVLPGAEPLNHTTKFAVWPEASVSGYVSPEIVN